jgi:hypothetical protein
MSSSSGRSTARPSENDEVLVGMRANVTRFRPDDEVFGQSLLANLWRHGGALAEYERV